MCSTSSRCSDASVTRARQLRGRCHHLALALPTGRHVRSTRDACSRRSVRHLVALSVHRRSHLSSSHDSRRTPAHSTLLSSSASTPSSPHSSAPSVEAPTTPHRSRAHLSHAKPAPEPPSAARNHRSTELAASFGCRGHLPIERHLQPQTCSSVTAVTSAQAHRYSTNPELALSTSSLACHRCFPTADLLRRCEPTMVSPSAAYAPNRDPHLRSEPRADGERGSFPVSIGRAKRPKWAKPFSSAGPSATPSVAHCNSALFLLSFELFKIQFKFSLNF
jgi:hypothetical protein